MSYRLRLLLMEFLVLGTYSLVYGQPQFVPNIPTPTVASLGTFGEIPVGHFTGIPQVHIPLHTIKTGNYELPVSVDYHLANVKPSTQCGNLGQGWSLMAGGYISRTVRGVYDERSDHYGYYENYSNMADMTHSEFVDHTVNHLYGDNPQAGNCYELCADEFSFSFCGYSGTFYLNESGGWTVASDDDIKVEFSSSTGFTNLSSLSSRINYSNWGNRYDNNRFFNKFTLITPDGCRYEFGGVSATDYCISYYQRNTSDLIPTTWKLSKITTPEGRSIEFTYVSAPLQCDVRYVPSQHYSYGLSQDMGCNTWMTPIENGTIQNGQRGYTGFLLFGTQLSMIETETETVTFHYFTDCHYGPNLVGRQALYWNQPGYVRENLLSAFQGDPMDQFDVFLNSHITSENDMLDVLGNDILSYISIEKSLNQESIHFDYTFNNRRKLSRIAFREGAYYPPSYNPDINHGYYIPPVENVDSLPEYRFKYDQVTMPAHYVLNGVDSWGFYNGTNQTISSWPSFQVRLPSLYYTKAETLREITFPSGCRTQFQYELNDYRKSVNPDCSLKSHSVSKTSGGLRVRQIDFLDKDSVLEKSTRYFYTTEKGNNISSGIARREPADSILFVFGSGNEPPYLVMKSEGGFFPDLTNHNSPEVGYSTVFEETFTPGGETTGYTRYDFSNYDTDVFGVSHPDQLPLDSANVSGHNYITPFTSNSLTRGKLLRKSSFDAQGNLVRKEQTHYTATEHQAMNIATQQALVIPIDPTNPTIIPYGWVCQVKTCSYLPSWVEAYDYSSGATFSSDRHFHYNNRKLLSKELHQTSFGDNIAYDYKYAYQNPQNTWMDDDHILTPVISQKISYGSEWMADSTVYGYFLKGSKKIPYLTKTMRKTDTGSIFDEVNVTRIDDWGNPVEYTDKGISHTLIWDQYGEHLLAHIVNCGYSQLVSALGNNPLNTIQSYREQIHSLLPNSHVYYYEYDDYGNLSYILTPETPETFYIHDMLGRLKEVYHYKNNATETDSYYNYFYPHLN